MLRRAASRLGTARRVGNARQPLSTSSSGTTTKSQSVRRSSAEHRVAESLVFEVHRYEERHEERLRSKASPEAMLNIAALEEELLGEMAAALGRVDAKLREKMQLMNEANEAVNRVLAKQPRDVPALLKVVEEFNKAQEAAMSARTDLIVQRQSAGFWLDNHTRIMQRYPIPVKKRVKMTF